MALPVAALVLTTLIWGSLFVVTKEVLTSIPVPLLLFLRYTFAFLTLIWVRPQRKTLVKGVLLGVLVFSASTTQTVGLVHTTASKAAFITGLSVVFTPFISSLYLRTQLPSQIYHTSIISIIGLALLTFDGSFHNLNVNIGDIWVLLCAFLYAISFVTLEALSPTNNILQLTTIQFYPMIILSFIWSIPHLHLITTLKWESYIAILYLAVICTILTSLLQFWAQKKVSATLTSVIFILEPVFATIFALILLHEKLSLRSYLGGILIVLAMFTGVLRTKKL